ncbi:MAG: chitobiase/beta-hexosaminidase C-terminal domain-containing protein [Verrucomicrobia bacterium]|nr:chitobiase/beta-hexosaminidase C-terminal domain-containing protein [Verrucomicrobiota bacterium]
MYLCLIFVAVLQNVLAQIPPSIVAPPRSQSNWAESNMILGVAATGTEPLSYQWCFNDVPIAGQTHPLLLLPRTKTSDTGSYSVMVTNSWGTVTSTPATVTIMPVLGTGSVVSWGDNSYGQTAVPPNLNGVTSVAAGSFNTVALKSDGTVVAWGDIYNGYYDGKWWVITVPEDLTGVLAVAAGYRFAAALKEDGTVVAWGQNVSGETEVPPGLGNVVAISASNCHTLALRSDGTVVAWGANWSGQVSVPEDLKGVVAVVAGYNHSVALKADGTVEAWGDNTFGQADVPMGLSDVTAIAAGARHSVALRSDGSVVTWGLCPSGNLEIKAGLAGPISLAAGWGHTMVLRSDGTPELWGAATPPELGGVTTMAGGYSHSAAITRIVGLPIRVLAGNTYVPRGAIVRDGQADIGLCSGFGNARIFYSTDGTTPFNGGPLTYNDRFTIRNTTTIRALAVNLDDSRTAASEPVTIYIRHPLTLSAAGGGTMVTSPSSTNDVVTITAIPDPGWRFMFWSGAASGTNAMISVTADQPKSAQATFGTTLNSTMNGNGSIEISPANELYTYGSTVKLTATPDNGNYFVGWGGVATGNANPLSYTITTANPAVSASFAPAPSTQTIDFAALPDLNLGTPPLAMSASASSGLPVSYSVLSGPATVAGNTLTITDAGTVTVRAIQSGNEVYSAAPCVDQSFTVYLTLATSAEGFGSVTREPDLARYTKGAVVVLTATPTPGFETAFSGWIGSATGTTNPLSVVMDENKVIKASFVSTNTTGIANVQLVSIDFNPKTVDVSFERQTVTVTAHLSSGGAPITRALVSFVSNFGTGLELELGPENLVSGDLCDGVFQGSILVDDRTRVGTYKLNYILLADQSGRYKTYSIAPDAAFPYPPGTPTDLVVTAPDHPTRFGIGTGAGVVFNGQVIDNPVFLDAAGNFSAPVPRKEGSDMNSHLLQRGETRKFMCISGSWMMFTGLNMSVSCALAAAPGKELQSDIGIRLMRAWTKDYFPGSGALQRDFLVEPPNGAPGDVPYVMTMLSDGPNAPTWSVESGFVITPPPGGFKESFELIPQCTVRLPPPEGQMTVGIVWVLGARAKFTVVDSPPFQITSFGRDPHTGRVTISWFGAVGRSYHVQWTSNLADGNWTTVPNGLIGADATLNWADDGTETAPFAGTSRFYRICIP